MTFSNWFKSVRSKKQEDLATTAKQLKVAVPTLYRWETEDVLPRAQHLLRIQSWSKINPLKLLKIVAGAKA